MYRKNLKVRTFLDYLYEKDYKERPVSIDEFICNPLYLGNSTNKGHAIYPYWRKALREIFSDYSKLMIVLTGSIGTGKSTAAIIGVCYIMYRLLCLKEPWNYFGKGDMSIMTISFFNLTKTLGDSRGFGKLQGMLLKSSWFWSQKGVIERGKGNHKYLEFPLFNYVLASPYARGFGTVGEDIICGVLDEVDSPTDSPKQKIRVAKAFESQFRRLDSRFVNKGNSLGKLFLVASRQEETAFLETFIQKMKNTGRVLVYDPMLWDVKPESEYSGKKFFVAVGDAFTPSKIIEEKERDEFTSKDFRIVEVPEEYKHDFELDLGGSLRDLAGITTTGSRKYKLISSESLIKECYDDKKLNPARRTTIEIGLKDEERLIWYLDLSKIRMDRSIPRCVHYDISINGDRSGLAMSGISHHIQKDVEREDGSITKQKVPVIETDFAIRLMAKEGDEIPIHKVRELLIDLRASGFNIKFTADLRLASADTLQILKRAGFNAEYLSVDRSDNAYLDFRNLIYEKRWCCHEIPVLTFELKHLEHNKEKGKVDHPYEVRDVEFLEDGDLREIVTEGTKDLSDAVAGSVASLLKGTIKPPVDMQVMRSVMARVTKEKVNLNDERRKFMEQISNVSTVVEDKKSSEIMKKVMGTVRRKR